jgi:hypothetical protein
MAVNTIISSTLGDDRLTIDNARNITTIVATETVADMVELEGKSKADKGQGRRKWLRHKSCHYNPHNFICHWDEDESDVGA